MTAWTGVPLMTIVAGTGDGGKPPPGTVVERSLVVFWPSLLLSIVAAPFVKFSVYSRAVPRLVHAPAAGARGWLVPKNTVPPAVIGLPTTFSPLASVT